MASHKRQKTVKNKELWVNRTVFVRLYPFFILLCDILLFSLIVFYERFFEKRRFL